MKWAKPEEYENLTKMAEHNQQISLNMKICSNFTKSLKQVKDI